MISADTSMVRVMVIRAMVRVMVRVMPRSILMLCNRSRSEANVKARVGWGVDEGESKAKGEG